MHSDEDDVTVFGTIEKRPWLRLNPRVSIEQDLLEKSVSEHPPVTIRVTPQRRPYEIVVHTIVAVHSPIVTVKAWIGGWSLEMKNRLESHPSPSRKHLTKPVPDLSFGAVIRYLVAALVSMGHTSSWPVVPLILCQAQPLQMGKHSTCMVSRLGSALRTRPAAVPVFTRPSEISSSWLILKFSIPMILACRLKTESGIEVQVHGEA